MDVIGNTLEEISAEKAGIIKNGMPCVIGPTCLELQPIFDRAKDQNSPIIKIED
jgi:dihydrofolate synthase/folylpolyglutamate synthase